MNRDLPPYKDQIESVLSVLNTKKTTDEIAGFYSKFRKALIKEGFTKAEAQEFLIKYCQKPNFP